LRHDKGKEIKGCAVELEREKKYVDIVITNTLRSIKTRFVDSLKRALPKESAMICDGKLLKDRLDLWAKGYN